MDFDKYLEKDMAEFLDEQARKIAEKAAGAREEEFDLYEITQDYAKDINKALKEEDLKKAQKVFEKVKTEYMNAPEDSLSKKRLYIIMEEVYEKIKDYEAREEGKKSLFESIQEYEEKGLFSKPELFKRDQTLNINLIFNTIDKKEEELEKLTKKKDITGEDLKQAVKCYRDLKELIKKLPQSHEKEKSKRYGSALTWYYTIKKLKQSLEDKKEVKTAEKKKGTKHAQPEVPVENELEKIRKLKEKIVESHTRISNYLKNKELLKSMQEYKHLKHLCEQFPQHLEEEKTALLADALSLYENIKRLKQQLTMKRTEEKDEKEKQEKEISAREKIREKIHDEINIIKTLLEKKDAVTAIKKYKEIKEVFNHYPEHRAEEKKQLYDKILRTHKDIKLLEEDLKRKTPLHKINQSKAFDIDNDLTKAHELLDQGQSEEATHKILEAKHKIQMLPSEAFDEKYRLLKEIEKLEHKSLFVKNVEKINIK